jgi:hypothetical protein
LSSVRLFSSKFARTALLQREYNRFLRKKFLSDLGNPGPFTRPELHLVTTSFTTGNLCSFNRDGFWVDDANLNSKLYRAGSIIPIGLAVAASSAFPPLFPPVALTRHMLGASIAELPYDPEYLTDGGVFDNLGFEKFARLQAQDKLQIDYLLVSDAGASFDWNIKARFFWIISRTVRSTDILMERVANATLAKMALEPGEKFKALHIPIGHVVSDSGVLSPLPGDLQKRISKIRTDLDAFSSLEIHLLTEHGYEVAYDKLRTLPEFATQMRKVVQRTNEALNIKMGDAVSTARTINRSRRRSSGFVRLKDWVSYALLVWCLSLIAAPVVPLIYQWVELRERETALARREPTEAIKDVMFQIRATGTDRNGSKVTRVGTGVGIYSDPASNIMVLATTAHVVGSSADWMLSVSGNLARTISVAGDRSRWKEQAAEVVAYDETHDLALLLIHGQAFLPPAIAPIEQGKKTSGTLLYFMSSDRPSQVLVRRGDLELLPQSSGDELWFHNIATWIFPYTEYFSQMMGAPIISDRDVVALVRRVDDKKTIIAMPAVPAKNLLIEYLLRAGH